MREKVSRLGVGEGLLEEVTSDLRQGEGEGLPGKDLGNSSQEEPVRGKALRLAQAWYVSEREERPVWLQQ